MEAAANGDEIAVSEANISNLSTGGEAPQGCARDAPMCEFSSDKRCEVGFNESSNSENDSTEVLCVVSKCSQQKIALTEVQVTGVVETIDGTSDIAFPSNKPCKVVSHDLSHTEKQISFGAEDVSFEGSRQVVERMECAVNDGTESPHPTPGIVNVCESVAEVLPDGENLTEDKPLPSSQSTMATEHEIVHHPVYNFDKIFEMLNSGSFFSAEQYLDSCKWSPDGTCLLTCCADRRLRLFDFPTQLYNKSELESDEKIDTPFHPSLTVCENGAVYDYEWFPFMSSWQPETACFISASSSAPVHLIDAFTGSIRASYTGLNHVFEVASCFGLVFSLDGAQIFCGYRNMIKIFDVAVPGTNCRTLNTKKLNEQTGYISCIAQNPAMPRLFAAGSFSRTVGLYTTEGDAVCLLKGQRNGLTSLAYSTDGTKLFSGSRMDPEILCWDLRNPGQVLNVLPRVMDTNQRIRISVSVDGNFLLTGGTDGVVRIWRLDEVSRTTGVCEPHIKFKAHSDSANGVSLNGRYPVLATSSGKRHTPDIVSDDDSDQVFSYKNFSKKTENRVSLWWVGPQK